MISLPPRGSSRISFGLDRSSAIPRAYLEVLYRLDGELLLDLSHVPQIIRVDSADRHVGQAIPVVASQLQLVAHTFTCCTYYGV